MHRAVESKVLRQHFSILDEATSSRRCGRIKAWLADLFRESVTTPWQLSPSPQIRAHAR